MWDMVTRNMKCYFVRPIIIILWKCCIWNFLLRQTFFLTPSLIGSPGSNGICIKLDQLRSYFLVKPFESFKILCEILCCQGQIKLKGRPILSWRQRICHYFVLNLKYAHIWVHLNIMISYNSLGKVPDRASNFNIILFASHIFAWSSSSKHDNIL